MFEDDTDHPIPYVGNLDTVVETNVGAYFGLVIASPLSMEKRSEARLRKKLDNYFQYFAVIKSEWSSIHSEPMKVRLMIAVHHASDPRVLAVLHEASLRAAENNIEFSLASIDDEYKIHG